MNILQNADPDILEIIQKEKNRQMSKLELIASENFASDAVLAAAGTILTNKYAEGYPGRRYYGGCEFVDQIEDIACVRACKLFAADYANVQPHSGSQANAAIYLALLQPGETILSMDLAHGGHLSHGAAVSFSGKIYNAVQYGVSRDTELLDYEAIRMQAKECRPSLIVAGASAYSRVIDFQKFRAISDEVNALLVVDMAHIAGLVAAEQHPSPIPHAHVVSTTTHKTLRGPRGGLIFIGKDGQNTLGVAAPKSGRVKRWSELIDSAVMPGIQGGPLMHIIAAKAVAFQEGMQPNFRAYQRQIICNARVLAEHLQDGGLRLVSGGTDNHLVLVDLTSLHMSGKDAEAMLDAAYITCNKNGIPFDTRSPFLTSGIRLGTPALTTRGMKEDEMKTIAQAILTVLHSKGDKEIIQKVRGKVQELCKGFPLHMAH